MSMWSKEQRREYLAIGLLMLSLLALAAILIGPGQFPTAACYNEPGGMGPAGYCLRSFFVQIFGLPATVLLALTPAHLGAAALRAYEGRVEPFLVPILLRPRAAPADRARPRRERVAGRVPSNLSGYWGSFWSFYLDKWFKAGAWFVLAAMVSIVAFATIALNPIRVLLGLIPRPSAAVPVIVEEEAPSKKKRRKDNGLEPAPEELPAIEPSPRFFDEEPPVEKKKKKSKAELTAEHDERIAAAIDAHVPEADDELPPPTLLDAARSRDHAEEESASSTRLGDKLMDDAPHRSTWTASLARTRRGRSSRSSRSSRRRA